MASYLLCSSGRPWTWDPCSWNSRPGTPGLVIWVNYSCVCVRYMRVHVYAAAYPCVYLWGRRSALGVFITLHLIFWDESLHRTWSLPHQLGCLSVQPASFGDLPISLSFLARIPLPPDSSSFYRVALGVNESGLLAVLWPLRVAWHTWLYVYIRVQYKSK